MSTHEPTPILCRTCGGPLVAVAEVHLECPYCGARDELPRETHARVRELRRRLAARARSMEQLSGLAATMALVYERPGRNVHMWTTLLFVGSIVVARAAVLCDLQGRTAEALVMSLFVVLLDYLPMISFPLGLVCAYFVGRRFYRNELRWRLVAWPSRLPEGRAACRCCAAELPREHGPLIRCRHCGTHSLVTAGQQADVGAALKAEEQARRQQRAAFADQTRAIGSTLDKIYQRSLAVGVLGCLGLWWLLSALFGD